MQQRQLAIPKSKAPKTPLYFLVQQAVARPVVFNLGTPRHKNAALNKTKLIEKRTSLNGRKIKKRN